MEISTGVRAKAGYIRTKRYNKNGKVVAAKDHMMVSAGMHSAKEMEKLMLETAEATGADHTQIVVETYQNGEAPMTANPRHRGEYTRRQWGGWAPPTKEELEAQGWVLEGEE